MARRLLRWFAPPLILALLAGGVYGVSRLTLDPELEARNQALHDELMRVEARNGRLRGDIAALRSEIGRLRTDESESLNHARTELGMIRPGEVVYQFDDGRPTEAGASGSPTPASPGPAR